MLPLRVPKPRTCKLHGSITQFDDDWPTTQGKASGLPALVYKLLQLLPHAGTACQVSFVVKHACFATCLNHMYYFVHNCCCFACYAGAGAQEAVWAAAEGPC